MRRYSCHSFDLESGRFAEDDTGDYCGGFYTYTAIKIFFFNDLGGWRGIWGTRAAF